MFSYHTISGVLSGSVCCGKGMDSIRTPSKTFRDWSLFYQPSGWANLPSMIPDPSGWASSHTACTTHGSSVCYTKWSQVTGCIGRRLSVRQAHCLKHVHHHLWNKVICTGPSSPLPPAKHTLTVEGVDHLYLPENILVNGRVLSWVRGHMQTLLIGEEVTEILYRSKLD